MPFTLCRTELLMADNDTDLGDIDNPDDAEPGFPDGDSSAAENSGAAGGGFKALFSGGRLKLLLAFPAAGLLSAVAVGLLMFGGDSDEKPPESAPVALSESAKPLISSSRAREIAEFRSELRRTNRSSRNTHLQKQLGEDELYLMAVRGELSLLARMFDHYVATTARFYELFRIMANDYVEEPSQLRRLFEEELLPDYKATEQRRRMLRRRVEHDQAVELYNRLDYIAYHDSIAVNSFQDFLTEGGTEKFANTAELVSTSKFMIMDFSRLLMTRLQEYDMEYDVSENIWDRYYGKWPW
jgi:hypothetical protein